MKYYVDAITGIFIEATDSTPPENSLAVEPAPEYADQVWLFPGWGPSPSQLAIVQNDWRIKEMEFIADNLLYIEDENPLATTPLVLKTWRNYRIKVMAWTDTNVDFPDLTKRPVRPT